MGKEFWTSSDIMKLYRMNDRNKSIQTLYNAEERGEIPKAHRINRGQISVRNWHLAQLPAIGRKFGFITPHAKQIVISKYIQKGGVLKSTTSFNEAKTFALNGLKTLIIGQDFECSITDIILPKQDFSKLDDIKKNLGLYHFFVEHAPLNEIIKHTSLPTLDIIPETHDLVVLDKWLAQQKRREYLYLDKLIPYLKEYDVILYDNNPGWSHLVENSLVCSDTLISPLGCTLLAYNASETNFQTIFDFQEIMGLNNQKIIIFSTLLDRNSLSQQIYAQYLSMFNDYIIPIPIRKTVKGEEALVHQQSILEYAPTSPFANEYYLLIKAIWDLTTSRKTIAEIKLQVDSVGE